MLIFCSWFIPTITQAISIFGTVTNNNGKPLPYANIIIKGTTKGTTTNIDGKYELELKPGDYQVVFRYTGYKSKIKQVSVKEEPVKLNVTLEKQAYNMETVTVTGEDPAYRIVRNAIDRKPAFRKEVKQYQCKVYSKAKMKTDTLTSEMLLDSSDLPKGYIYLSESLSNLYYQHPGEFKEEMISSRVSGNQVAFSFNFAFNEPVSFYENLIDLGGSSKRPIVSPIANNALFFYDYKWEGTFRENKKRIHRIKVIPKRESDPVFEGYMNIVNKTWRIKGVNLSIEKANGLRQFDSFRIKQTYVPVTDSVWRLYNQNFRVLGNLVGMNLTLNAISHFSEYDISPDLGDDYFDNELVKITEEASGRDENYWDTLRPVKLKPDEQADFRIKDSLEKVRNSKTYIDSVDSIYNQPSVGDIVYSGYNHRKRTANYRFSISPILISLLRYNTIEGWVPKIQGTFKKTYEEKPDLSISPFVRYGFANNHLNGGLSLHRNPWQLKAGRTIRQFNPNKPISRAWNTSYTLLSGANYMKIYESTYAEIGFSEEIGNGLFPSFNLRWAKRDPLQNNTDFTLSEEEQFTPNKPDHPYFENIKNFEPHKAFILDAKLTIKPGMQYMTVEGEKRNLGTDWPTFQIGFKKAVPGIAGSDANYGMATLGINGDIDFQLLGRLNFKGTGGLFTSKNRTPFMDYRHFNGQEITYYNYNKTGFQLLDYYEGSTTEPFAEGHITHQFNGFLWNKLPWIKQWQWEVVAEGNLLYRKDQPMYWEWGVGLSNILNLMGSDLIKVSFFHGYSGKAFKSRGFRIGFGLGQFENL